MERIKGKAIRFIFCFLYLAVFYPGHTVAGSHSSEKYVVQVAASKTPMNISAFAKKYNLTDSVTEIFSPGWYRYVVGNFKGSGEAEFYARMLRERGLTGAFARNYLEIDGAVNLPSIPDQITSRDTTSILPQIDTITSKTGIAADTIIAESVQTDSTGLAKKEPRIFSAIFKNNQKQEVKERLVEISDQWLPTFMHSFGNRVIDAILLYPAILFLIFLIFIFFLNVLFVLFVLYISNKVKNHKDRHILIYRKMYEEALLSYFFGMDDWEKTLIRLKQIHKPLNRKIIVSILFSIQENLKGGIDKDIPEIFVKLGLHRDAWKLAKSWFYFRRIEGFRQLTYLYPQGAMKIIPQYLNTSNDLVRAEAQTSYVRLHEQQPFGFFNDLKKPFTRWTQLTSFHLLRLYNLQVDSFAGYLSSQNSNVSDFCLRMITYFQQLENAEAVFGLIGSKLEMTRFLAYRAINDLRLFEAKGIIKDRFSIEPEKNRMEIIKAFRNIGCPEDFEFLLTVFKEGTVSEKIEVCRTLYFVDEEGKKLIESMRSQPEMEVEKYIAHITDPRN